jgi:hypothetical protein
MWVIQSETGSEKLGPFARRGPATEVRSKSDGSDDGRKTDSLSTFIARQTYSLPLLHRMLLRAQHAPPAT